MNIALLNDSFPPVIDGVVNVMMNYAEHLMRDHASRVIVGTPRYPDTDYSSYPYPVVPYHSIDTSAVTNGYRAGMPMSEKALSELADFQPDIIHAHCPASAMIIARLLREETGAPIVFTYHTKYDIDIRRAVKSELLQEEAIRAMIANIEACDAVWVVSRGAGESLTELGYTGEWHVMNNGVDFAKGRVDDAAVAEAVAGYDLPEDVPLFLYVGRLMNYKNLPLVLDALKILAERGIDFRMVFIGKGPDGDFLKEKARELGLYETGASDKCIFTGPVYDRDVLRAWNTRADLFVFPSTFDTNGLVVREAAACGLASVLVRSSCAAEDVTDGRNGFLIEETAESLAAKLAELIGAAGGSEAEISDGQTAGGSAQAASWAESPARAVLREAGQRAMDELYASWEDCVNAAYERYQYVLEKKAAGVYAEKKKEVPDLLISLAARNMSGQAQLRKQGEEWLRGLRDTAGGMLDNAADRLDEAVDRLDLAAEKLDRAVEKLDSAAGRRDFVTDFLANATEILDAASEKEEAFRGRLNDLAGTYLNEELEALRKMEE